jgi:hypothetical protein
VQERALRRVLLIQAIEETDRRGEALPLAERTEATRAVLGKKPPPGETQSEAPLSSATEWFLARRADLLLRSLRARSPGIDQVLAVAGGAISSERGLLVIAFVVGVLLPFLDGGHGIDILAAPLVALVAWNLLVYVLMLGSLLRRSDAPTLGASVGVTAPAGTATAAAGAAKRRPGAATATAGAVQRYSWLANLYSRWVRGHLDRLLAHSTRFNAPLAPGLRRFVGDWWDVAQPLFAARARRLLHLCAALVAFGLVAGYYFRAHVLLSPAGWADSNLFGPTTAHAVLTLLYGPAALLAGVALPTTEGIAQLRWTVGAHGGGDASVWVHLIAWTAAVYIVLPRMLAALISTFNLWRLSRRLALPPGVASYVRTLFAAETLGEPHDV